MARCGTSRSRLCFQLHPNAGAVDCGAGVIVTCIGWDLVCGKIAHMDEIIFKIADGYLQILAWIGNGLPYRSGMLHEAYVLKASFTEVLQSYSKTNLEGLDLAQHVIGSLDPAA